LGEFLRQIEYIRFRKIWCFSLILFGMLPPLMSLFRVCGHNAQESPKRLPKPLEGLMGKKLYVGNLPYTTDEQSLADTFAECGTVESVKIITDRDTGRSKGFGFIEMSSDEEAQSAISKFNGQQYEGRALTVNEAKPMAPREGGGGGRGGFGGGRGGGGRGGDRW
jgi:uncharacterized membrane protein YgcG